MKRREFLNLTMGALALAVVPASVRAEDYRKSKPTVWTIKNVMKDKKVTDDGVTSAIKALYGSNALTMEGINLKTPDTASNGGAVPVDFSTDKDVKSIAVFQNANPETTVMVVDVNKYSVNKYSIKIKMASSGTITVVAQGNDGKLYAAKKTLNVALGGCEG